MCACEEHIPFCVEIFLFRFSLVGCDLCRLPFSQICFSAHSAHFDQKPIQIKMGGERGKVSCEMRRPSPTPAQGIHARAEQRAAKHISFFFSFESRSVPTAARIFLEPVKVRFLTAERRQINRVGKVGNMTPDEQEQIR